ncbi:MAG: hypothetical protein ACEPOV_06380 [Hyphomicrobiales bacterium]
MEETLEITGHKQFYEAELPAMLALDPDDVKLPTIPIEEFVYESENLYSTATRYFTELTKYGLTQEMLDTLLSRARALREAQAIWTSKYNALQEKIKLWDDASKECGKLQERLNKTFRFALRKEPRLLKRAKEIGKSSNDRDMIQDLQDYCALGKEYPDYFTAINFNTEEFADIDKKALEYGRLYSDAISQKNKQHDYKDIRDRAFTILNNLVRDIRDYGRFAFYKDDNIKKLFVSEYHKRHRNKGKEDPDEKKPTTPPKE